MIVAASNSSEYTRVQRERAARADVLRQYLLASLVGVTLLIVVVV